jgi:hypothetical protein
MTNTAPITVTGYFEGGSCGCCGRELRHCVQTDAGTFGARCFAVKVTKPRIYAGKPYRLSTDAVISLAKQARNPVRFGLQAHHLSFEAAA